MAASQSADRGAPRSDRRSRDRGRRIIAVDPRPGQLRDRHGLHDVPDGRDDPGGGCDPTGPQGRSPRRLRQLHDGVAGHRPGARYRAADQPGAVGRAGRGSCARGCGDRSGPWRGRAARARGAADVWKSAPGSHHLFLDVRERGHDLHSWCAGCVAPTLCSIDRDGESGALLHCFRSGGDRHSGLCWPAA